MKNNILYIVLIFALCFGFKAQAQNIIGYHTKLDNLSSEQADQLIHLVNGPSTTIFVTEQNEADIFKGNTTQVAIMKITQSSDFDKLAQHFEKQMNEVVVLDIEWDGQEELVMPDGLLEQMPNLKYIYIRSNEVLNTSVIQNRFSNLINKLNGYTNVEVLYYTMEQPS
ncbi:hypothetical protein [Myroides marinus]|uniref:hypothetical protein n=1 Tax=Myroides marinus TaxID=703342 RepID=UPI002578C57E|nr:hypothetical protein [Myroides marinus]MDM1354286.1 hypothetical protein [Myroides marinus]